MPASNLRIDSCTDSRCGMPICWATTITSMTMFALLEMPLFLSSSLSHWSTCAIEILRGVMETFYRLGNVEYALNTFSKLSYCSSKIDVGTNEETDIMDASTRGTQIVENESTLMLRGYVGSSSSSATNIGIIGITFVPVQRNISETWSSYNSSSLTTTCIFSYTITSLFAKTTSSDDWTVALTPLILSFSIPITVDDEAPYLLLALIYYA